MGQYTLTMLADYQWIHSRTFTKHFYHHLHFFQGAFICIYAGNVLSDEEANKLGRSQGDEYFADLDLILCAENQKEGYEEEVVEPEEM